MGRQAAFGDNDIHSPIILEVVMKQSFFIQRRLCLKPKSKNPLLKFNHLIMSQGLSRQSNVPTSDLSISSSTLCSTRTSRARPTGAETRAALTEASAWTVGGIAATLWATTSTRFALAPARGSTWRRAPRCLTNVRSPPHFTHGCIHLLLIGSFKLNHSSYFIWIHRFTATQRKKTHQ